MGDSRLLSLPGLLRRRWQQSFGRFALECVSRDESADASPTLTRLGYDYSRGLTPHAAPACGRCSRHGETTDGGRGRPAMPGWRTAGPAAEHARRTWLALRRYVWGHRVSSFSYSGLAQLPQTSSPSGSTLIMSASFRRFQGDMGRSSFCTRDMILGGILARPRLSKRCLACATTRP